MASLLTERKPHPDFTELERGAEMRKFRKGSEALMGLSQARKIRGMFSQKERTHTQSTDGNLISLDLSLLYL